MQSFPPWRVPQYCRCVFVICAHGLAYSRIVNAKARNRERDTAAKSWQVSWEKAHSGRYTSAVDSPHPRQPQSIAHLLLLRNVFMWYCVPFPTGMQTRRRAGGQTGNSPGSCRKLRSRTVTVSSPSRAATCSITCSASIVAYGQTPSALRCLDPSDK